MLLIIFTRAPVGRLKLGLMPAIAVAGIHTRLAPLFGQA